MVVAPFLAAMFAGVRQTAIVASAAVLSALLSGSWNDNFGDPGYEVRAAIVIFGGTFSVLAARTRGEAIRAEALGEQLTAALSNLAEAVVVQGRDQRLVYANDAAPRRSASRRWTSCSARRRPTSSSSPTSTTRTGHR